MGIGGSVVFSGTVSEPRTVTRTAFGKFLRAIGHSAEGQGFEKVREGGDAGAGGQGLLSINNQLSGAAFARVRGLKLPLWLVSSCHREGAECREAVAPQHLLFPPYRHH